MLAAGKKAAEEVYLAALAIDFEECWCAIVKPDLNQHLGPAQRGVGVVQQGQQVALATARQVRVTPLRLTQAGQVQPHTLPQVRGNLPPFSHPCAVKRLHPAGSSCDDVAFKLPLVL